MINAVSGEEQIFTGNIKQIAGSQETREMFLKIRDDISVHCKENIMNIMHNFPNIGQMFQNFGQLLKQCLLIKVVTPCNELAINY